jgi:NTP pyrophosphatase (non-canonical NTP hydrolase)
MYDNIFDNLAINLHEVAVEKGFWPEDIDDIFVAKQCMMIVSEVTEVMEAIRKDKGEEEITKEFADIIIRTLDLYAGLVEAGYTKLSLDEMLREKVEFNKTRPEKHGVRF